MDRKTVEEALKLQAEFSAKLTQNLDAVRAGRKLTVEGALKDKQREVERAGNRLQALEKNRAEAITRLDREIARSKEDLERLQAELTTIEARLKETGGNVTGPGDVVREDGEIRRRSGPVVAPVVRPGSPRGGGGTSGGGEGGGET